MAYWRRSSCVGQTAPDLRYSIGSCRNCWDQTCAGTFVNAETSPTSTWCGSLSKESKQGVVAGLESGADDYLIKPFDQVRHSKGDVPISRVFDT